jgi:putative transposase
VQLAHKIALSPTSEQAGYFARACGTARKVWNWALDEWNKQYAAGQKPNAMALKKQFNAIKYQLYPWLTDIHRDAHAQAFTHLARAWSRFFAQIKAGQRAHEPKFKKKGRCRDRFYIANDKFAVDGKTVRLPKVGDVRMTETLRFAGKILGATVSRTAARWFIAIQVDVPDEQARRRRTGHGVAGADIGINSAVTLSTGEKIVAPKPLKAALRRLKIRSRRLARQVEAAKRRAGIQGPLPKGTRLQTSANQKKCAASLAKLHARVTNVRADFLHKLTARLCRENQAVGLETLNVKGMLANDRLSRALSDVGLGEFARQMQYKALRHGTLLVKADQWYPSSKQCHVCHALHQGLTLKDREWTCAGCGTHHDRDDNASQNLKQLVAAALAEKTLPVASRSATKDTAAGRVPAAVGKVTPVRDEFRQQEGSGQEGNCAHFCARF